METTLTPAEIEVLMDMVLERFHAALEEDVITNREDAFEASTEVGQ